MYFLAGALLPSIAFLFHHVLVSTTRNNTKTTNANKHTKTQKVKRNDDDGNTGKQKGHVQSKNTNDDSQDEYVNDDPDEYDDNDDDDEYEEDDDDDSSLEVLDVAMDVSKSWGIKDAPYKMVLCVNTSLSMGKGKIAAQCCHAAVGCYKRAKILCPNGLKAWERTGCAKIAVKCPSEDEMMNEILIKAMQAGIPVYFVEDAGRTQIAAGSRTVLGLGPAPVYAFEGITSHLKLM